MNAIILAAGMGTRLRPLTNNIPKCLVKVKGTPIVERQLQFLKDVGINDITMVSGYQANKLSYLHEKYGVDIVFNEKYDSCNNVYSIYKVLDRFEDSWIVEGDVYMRANCFTTEICQSTYFAKWHGHYVNEWGLETDKEGMLKNIHIGDGQGYVMSGISFWNKEDSGKVRGAITSMINGKQYEDLFWDHAVLSLYKQLNIKVTRFDSLFEIDSVSDLRKAENNE
ncbi:MAG: NTP transferase domain-containing protein [Prevotella sp.]|nr:NTP transferase domain-containing protein [Prevotella sp.]